MKLSPIIWLFHGIILFNLLASPSTEAQIVPDTTLLENSVIKTQDSTIQIDGGTRVGDNLFHSFEQFSVPSDTIASFNNAVDIRNIFSRVTGNSISEINGIINASGTANFFLLNPKGIIFGSNAQLNIGGSFLATTASTIIFADGIEFSTTATQTQPLLTISVPVGLGFRETPGSIINRSIVSSDSDLIGLRVLPNRTLALVGGDVSIEGGFLSTEGGRIELGSVVGNNIVNLTPIDQGWALSYEGIQNFQDISLSQAAFVVSGGNSSGDIQIQGRQVTLVEGSQIAVIALSEGQAGNLTVKASESVQLEGNSADAGFDFSLPTLLFNEVYGEAIGEGSRLTIETPQLILKNGAQISAGTFGNNRGVDLKVSASIIELEDVFIDAENRITPSGLFARVGESAIGDGGTLTIETENLIIKNGAQVSTETYGAGRGGDLVVNASLLIELIGTVPNTNAPSALFPGVKDQATGNGGNLSINTAKLIIRDGAQIGTTAQNQGKAGTSTINASNSILLTGTSSLAEFRGEGRSGIFVSAEPAFIDDADNLIITSADAGELNITTAELIVEKGAIISADNFGTGQGANVILNIDRLMIQDGGQIGAGSLLEKDAVNNERGAGGNLTVNAREFVDITGTGMIGSTSVPSSLFTQAEGTGEAGNINIITPQLTVQKGSEINVSATGSGSAGNLTITADSIRLDQGRLTAETNAGSGANITLQNIGLLLMSNQSLVSAQAFNSANGGDITINAENGFITAVPEQDSDIIANASEGRGGNIQVTAQGIFGIEPRRAILGNGTNDIDASSQFGVNGVVEINRPDVDPSRGLANLPAEPTTAEVVEVCQAASSENRSEFIITGRGGVPPSPREVLSSDAIQVGWVTLNPESASPSAVSPYPTHPAPAPIEAQGWVIGTNGKVVLTAHPPSSKSFRSWHTSC